MQYVDNYVICGAPSRVQVAEPLVGAMWAKPPGAERPLSL